MFPHNNYFGISVSFGSNSGDRDCWVHLFLIPACNKARRHPYSLNHWVCYFALTFVRMHHVLGNVMPSDRIAKRGNALDEYFLEHLVIGGETPHGRCDAQVARYAPRATRMGPLIDPGSVPMSDRDSGSATPGASPGATTGATLGATLGAALSSGPVL